MNIKIAETNCIKKRTEKRMKKAIVVVPALRIEPGAKTLQRLTICHPKLKELSYILNELIAI